MNPLNDDELTSLLKQAKREAPEPPWEMDIRTLSAYRAAVGGQRSWHQMLRRGRLSIPWPIGALIALLFVFIGAWADRRFISISVTELDRTSEARSTQATTILRFKDFQPVSELKPRVIRRIRNDK